MIKILFTAAAGLCALSACAQNGFLIKGKIDTSHNGQKVMLEYDTREHGVRDSTVIQNGSFLFKGKTEDVVKAYIKLKPLHKATVEDVFLDDSQDFFLENKNISINGTDISSATINGGGIQADYLALKSFVKPVEEKRKALSRQLMRTFRNKDTAEARTITPKLKTLNTEMFNLYNTFIHQHPDSYVSLYLLNERSNVIDPAKFEPYFNGLSERVRNTSLGKHLAARLKMAKATDIGQKAIDFTQNDTEGAPISLSSLKGKYVLIDFWASWCAPCRAENPEVVKVYQEFKDRNFQIIGVSLDSKKEPWLKAIQADGLPWIHVSDLLGWKNAVAVKYGVTSVPQNFLVDPNGIIVAKNLRGEELEKALNKIIKP